MIALFEAGLPPPVRLEMMRKDPPLTFFASRLQAKKHAAHHTTTQTFSATAAEAVVPTQPTPQPKCRTLQQDEKTWGIRWPGRDE